jgi:hypothetical protein
MQRPQPLLIENLGEIDSSLDPSGLENQIVSHLVRKPLQTTASALSGLPRFASSFSIDRVDARYQDAQSMHAVFRSC